jgi:hypothetical protein
MDHLLCTTITRAGADGIRVEYDVTVYFTVESYAPGYPATRSHPAEGAEIECAFERAELLAPDDHHDLTEAEMMTLRAWFAANHDKACAAAADSFDGHDWVREAANDNFRGLEA